ncbi:unnamed protein product [Oikopleura dioica]|uniref:Activating transcription factor 7-interacting protein Fn3 domain-containing protein n=1 Tax=Oikopleura dioica TaxID=34765 RepID=E4Y190_OIKDI|nr:unnamed protein product [Oikopleura dioica]
MENLNGHSTEVESGISALRKKEKAEKENRPIGRRNSSPAPASEVISSDDSNGPVENGNGREESQEVVSFTDELMKKKEEVKKHVKSNEKLKSELETANKELKEELRLAKEKLNLITAERDNYQNLYRKLSEKFDEKVEQFKDGKDYRPAAKYDEIIPRRMAKFAERAAKGKTDVKEYKETLKNIQIISSNQKTIFDKLTLWIDDNKALTKQIAGLSENAERFNLLRKKTFSNNASNTILMDETPLHFKRLSIGNYHTPTPFKEISAKDSTVNGIHQSADSVSSGTVRGVHSRVNLSAARCSKIQSSPTIPSQVPVPQQAASKRPAVPNSTHQQVPYQVVNGMPLNLNNYNCMSISLPKDAKVIQSCQIINGKIVKTGTTQLGSSSVTNSPLMNSIAAKSVSSNSPSSPTHHSPKFSTPPEQVKLKRSPPPSKKRKSEEVNRASIDLTSDDEEQPKKKAMMSSPQAAFINAPGLVIANAVPINLVPANQPVPVRQQESPPRKNLPRMLDSDIPECNKVTLNDGAVRILPPLPVPPKFKMPKLMPSDLKQLPHTLQLEANFSGDNKMIIMWDNVKNSNEKKNRADAKTYELFVCTILDEEEKNEDGDPKPLKWKRIGGKDVPGHRIPVKCSLKNFPRKGNYIFIVRGKDCYGRVGSFSEFAVAKTPSVEASSELPSAPKKKEPPSGPLSDTPTSSVTKSTTIL